MTTKQRADRFLSPQVLEQTIGVIELVAAHDDSLDDSDRQQISHVVDMLDRLVEDGGLVMVPGGQR